MATEGSGTQPIRKHPAHWAATTLSNDSSISSGQLPSIGRCMGPNMMREQRSISRV